MEEGSWSYVMKVHAREEGTRCLAQPDAAAHHMELLARWRDCVSLLAAFGYPACRCSPHGVAPLRRRSPELAARHCKLPTASSCKEETCSLKLSLAAKTPLPAWLRCSLIHMDDNR
ncbi:hypothetical protein Dimus_016485 [Dionaea muscipula]